MQGLPIGGKLYNGYSIVTNSESDKVVFEENIYILNEDTVDADKKYYSRIGDNELIENTGCTPSAGDYSDAPAKSTGRLNLDFERAKVIVDGEMKYYYPLKDYNASYNSVVMQNNVTTYDDIYEHIETNVSDDLAKEFYTALGRERGGMYMTIEDIDESPGENEGPGSGDEGGNSNPDTPSTNYNYTIAYHLNIGGVTAIQKEGQVNNNPVGLWTLDGIDGETDGKLTKEEIDGEIYIKTNSGTWYKFLGWNENPYETVDVHYKYGSNEFSMYVPAIQDDNDFWAVLEPVTIYHITYKLNDGTNAYREEYVPKDEKLTVEEPKRDGYEFLGWSENPDATEADEGLYRENYLYFEPDRDYELYAVWAEAIKTYTITYNANGGSVTPSLITRELGSVITLPTPTKNNYTFTGWTASTDGEIYNGGDDYTVNGNVTFTANWQSTQYNITYNANGGTGALSIQTATKGVQTTLSETKPTRTGYTFLGWSTSQTATTATYSAGGSYIYSGPETNVTLYAVWKEEIKTYTIIFMLEDGEKLKGKVENPLVLTAGTEITFPGAEKTGFKFLGWSSSPTDKTVRYEEDKPWIARANLKLYPVWEEDIIKYTVTYNANGGSVTPSSYEVNAGDTVTLPEPTKDGCRFIGWSKPTGETYGAGVTYEVNEDITFAAIWEFITYTITYDANGGSTSPNTITASAGATINLNKKPTRPGYSFVNWMSSSGKTYDAEEKYIVNNNEEFTANWKAIQYTVTYNANEGLFESGSETMSEIVEYDEEITSTEPTRDGYIFKGWSTSIDGEVKYGAGAQFKETTNTTLYAIWKIPDTYTITFDFSDGGSWMYVGEGEVKPDNPMSLIEGSAIGTIPDPWKIKEMTGSYPNWKFTYYTFAGWKDKETGIIYKKADLANIIPTKDMEFIATWK